MKKKSFFGYVISNKMNKTLVVSVTRLIKHKIYRKYIRRKSKIYVHDEFNKCNIGDLIQIKECSPYSKKKSWKLYKILESSM